MDKKELMNKFSYILELNEKKKQPVLESKILVDKDLEKMKAHFESIRLAEFVDNTREDKSTVVKYDKKFFKENLPLQKILILPKKGSPYKGSPFDIIKFKDDISFSYVDYYKILDGKYKGRIGFTKVYMLDDITRLTYAHLGHELVHTQIEKNPNLLENAYDKEVLSIFIEMVISRSVGKDELNDIIRYRFKNVSECITDLSKISKCEYTTDQLFQYRCYLASSLKALHLYDIYKHSSTDRRLEILGLVEDVFRDKITVERFLELMKVTYKNSKDVDMIKHYVKKY